MSIHKFILIEHFFTFLLNFFSSHDILLKKEGDFMGDNVSTRLKQIMSMRNLKQVDIIRKAEPFCRQYNVSLKKNDLSQYVSGKTNPGQKKLFLLALTLDVSEAWLMGYDVPMERVNSNTDKYYLLSDHEKILIAAYRQQTALQFAVDRMLGISDK